MDVEIRLPTLYPWQKALATAKQRHRCCVVSRRCGKTLTARTIAIKALLSGQKVLWIAPVHQQTKEQYAEMSLLLQPVTKSSEKNKELTLITGGKLWTRSADNPMSLRSLGYDLVIMDEFGFMDPECWATIRPTLADKGTGRALIISTPNGHNQLHSIFTKHKEDPEWFCFQHDWTCSPHITAEEMAKAQNEMTPGEFRQEFGAEFISPKGAKFEAKWLETVLVDSMPPPPYQRHIIATDFAGGGAEKGKHGDYQAIVYMAWCNGILYCECWAERLSIEAFNRKIKAVYEDKKPEAICVEVNFNQVLMAENLMNMWPAHQMPVIWEIDNKVKKETRIESLATLLSRGKLKVVNNAGGIEAFHELSDFPSKQTHDDVIDAIEQGYRALRNM